MSKQQDTEDPYEFKDVPGFDGRYQANRMGQIRSLLIMKPGVSQGYQFISTCVNGKKHAVGVHRLVMLAFVANPDNKPQVNHINGDPGDNRIENLEWVTGKENTAHAIHVLGKLPGRKDLTKISINGVERVKTEWLELNRIPNGTYWARVSKYGWSPERAMTEPVSKKTLKGKIDNTSISRVLLK